MLVFSELSLLGAHLILKLGDLCLELLSDGGDLASLEVELGSGFV